MPNFFELLLAPFAKMAKQPLESFVRLETADDEYTLVAADGSLITLIKVEGSRQIIGEQEYYNIVEQATVKLGARMDRPGHAIQCVFTRNPDRVKKDLRNLVRPNRQSAESIGMNLKDLFDERIRHISKFTASEDCYLACWSRGALMTKPEMKKQIKKRKAIEWVPAVNSQFPFAAMEGIKTRHRGFISAVIAALNEIGIQSSKVEVHDALAAIRGGIYPGRANDNWRACLPGDPLPPRAPENDRDFSNILWPSLPQQICTYDAEALGQHIVRIGNRLWSGVDMILPPSDPSPFPQLMRRLVEANIPFRISFLIESGGVEGASLKKMLSTLLGFTNAANIKIKDSLEALQELSRQEPVVKIRISAATWGPERDMDLIEDRISTLSQAIESWGYAQVSQNVGDSLDCIMSSALGIACASTAPAAIAPMSEVMKMLPWQRPSSPFSKGANLLRSPDGKIWPYQTGTSMTTTWFDLIFAQPGAGKSVLMNSLNLGTCLTAGLSELPFIAIIDIGPSSSGLISLIRDALPASRRYEAVHYRLSMSKEYAINPFDTQLGCRKPLFDERSYLVELLTLICTPPGEVKPYDGIPQMAGLVIDEMFRWRDDSEANSEPRPYLPRIDEVVDEALRAHNIHLPEDPLWWDVVDQLFDRELYHEATLAQRHAVPTLGDAVTAARRPQIRSLLEETKIGASTESVINAFERMVTSSIREYPILSGVTQFDIGDARICALDLMDVSPQGDETADRQTAVMYMLARHALVRNWWINEDSIRQMPEKYQFYHRRRFRRIKESPKRLCYDEFHRTSSSKAVRSQIIRDVREGRKWGVQIVLSSQLLQDFDDAMVDLATGVWILGAAISDSAVQDARNRFSLSETAVYIMRTQLTGPRSSGGPALFILGTNEGRYEQHLINTLGPIELWALSTSAEDVAIRQRLYLRLGAQRARQALALAFPGGSARSEIRRRIDAYAERGEAKKATTASVVEEIVDELVRLTMQRALEDMV